MKRRVIVSIFFLLFTWLSVHSQGEFNELELNEEEVKAYNNYTKRKINQLGKNIALLSDCRVDQDRREIVEATLELFFEPESVIVEDKVFENERSGSLKQYLRKIYYNASRKNSRHWGLCFSTNPTRNRIFRVYQVDETITEYLGDGTREVKKSEREIKNVKVKVIPLTISTNSQSDRQVKIITKLGDVFSGAE